MKEAKKKLSKSFFIFFRSSKLSNEEIKTQLTFPWDVWYPLGAIVLGALAPRSGVVALPRAGASCPKCVAAAGAKGVKGPHYGSAGAVCW